LGADIFLFNEGPVYCRSTGRNRGIKDWYAFGQVYVYVEAGVGINVCIPFFRPTCKCCRICPRLCCWERYDICARKEWSARVGLGAQFEGVRPFWGSVYVENPVKSFSIDVGKKCN
jgi:hypothetical protein